MISHDTWNIYLLMAILCTIYLLFIKDRNNYSEAIAGFIGVVFWILVGENLGTGIENSVGGIDQSIGTMWIFVIIGIIVGIITFIKILDIVADRKNDRDNHVNMSPIRL